MTRAAAKGSTTRGGPVTRDRPTAIPRRKPSPTVRRAAAFVALTAALTACDHLLTEPAAPTDDLSVSFSFEDAAEGGIASAFDKVDRVYLRFTRADSATRDTVVVVQNRDGQARARLVLDPKERIQALGVYAELRAREFALFSGARVIRVENGTTTSAEIPLTPVPHRLQADRQLADFAAVGDTLHLSSALLFVSGDTIGGQVGRWTSEDPTIVAVTSGGVALARHVGTTRLVVDLFGFADTVVARVR